MGIPLRWGVRVLVRVQVLAVVLTLGLGLGLGVPFARIMGSTPVAEVARPLVIVGLGARRSVEAGAGLLSAEAGLLSAEAVVFGLTAALAAAPGLAFNDGVNVPVLVLGPKLDTLARLAAVAALIPALAPVLPDAAESVLALATVLGGVDILPLPTPGFILELARVEMVDAVTGAPVLVA